MSEEQNIPKEEQHIPEHSTAPISSQVNDTASQIEPIPSTQPITESETPSMEVHHPLHVHHSKKWKDYLFEFFMLFLAVTAGFLMENQREHYVEQLRVKQYAKSLVSDLKKDTAMINDELRQLKFTIRQIDSLSAYVNGKHLNE